MADTVRSFLELLESGEYKVVDASVKTRPEVQSAVLPMCITGFKQDLLEYAELEPTNYEVDNGLKLNRYRNSDVITRPYKIEAEGSNFVVADYDKHSITVLDNNFNLQRLYDVYQDSETRSPRCVAFNDTHYFVGNQYRMLYAINKDTEEVEWKFGTYNSRGLCSDNKMGYPYQIAIAPNGNLLVATWDGAGDSLLYYGTLEEFTTDGTWVRTLLHYVRSGVGADYETRNPTSVRVYGNNVYVATANRIDVFDYSGSDMQYLTAIRKPNDTEADDLSVTDFAIDGNTLVIIASAMKKVVGYDLTTHDMLFAVGHYSYEAYSTATHEGNGMSNPFGIAISDGHIYIADNGNYNIYEVFQSDYITPTYDIPTGANVIFSCPELVDGVVKTPVGIEPPKLHLVYKTL